MYDFYFVALLCIPVAYSATVVGRTIIDKYQFVVGVGLLQNAFDAVLQVSSYFVNRYNDT